MPAMKWSEQLSVKIELFDNEHKKLIELINKLHDAMYRGEGQNALGSILAELADYTVTHFTHEEEILQKHNFPGFNGHKKQHEDFVGKVADTKKKYEEGALMLAIPLVDFLTSWIQNHILKTDSNYSEFLIKAGVR
jgi:hemerythrin